MIENGIILYLAAGIILMLNVPTAGMPWARKARRTAWVVFGWLPLLLIGGALGKGKKGGRRG